MSMFQQMEEFNTTKKNPYIQLEGRYVDDSTFRVKNNIAGEQEDIFLMLYGALEEMDIIDDFLIYMCDKRFKDSSNE